MSVTATGQEVWVYNDLAKKYGHLIRVGPNLVLTDDPDVLRRIAGARSTYGKDGFYRGTVKHPDYDNMFSTVDVPEHDKTKAKLAGAYGGRETLALEPTVDNFLTVLVQYLRAKCAKDPDLTTVVELASVINYFTMDIITRVAFGKEFGFLERDTDAHGILAANRAAIRANAMPIAIPWLRDITTSRWFLKAFGPKPTDKTGVGVAIRIAEAAIAKRYDIGAPEEKDLLGAFIRQGLQRGPSLSETLFVMVAGSDTTSSTLRCTMLYLITNPRVYQKLKEIVLQAVNEGRVSSPIKQEEAKTIRYLQAVIYEGLRMRPPGPIMFPKIVPPQGDEIDGKFLPGGTAVGWNLLPMLREARLWGRDPEIFRPERFSEVDDNTRASRERLVELAFGYGRFACAGKPLAQMELHKFYFELFRYFDFQVVNPAKPWESQVWTIWTENDFLVQVKESSLM